MTVHIGADVSALASVHESSTVWPLAQIREGAVLAEQVIVGRGAYIGTGVEVGARTKIQNYALVYEPAHVGEGVFIGPAVVLTNDRLPRSVTPEGRLKTGSDWDPVGVKILDGASIGARAVCVAPVVIGRWAMVAAGAVVVSDVPDFALVAGVPARQIGWVGRFGARLVRVAEGRWVCPHTCSTYAEHEGRLKEDPPFDAPTPGEG